MRFKTLSTAVSLLYLLLPLASYAADLGVSFGPNNPPATNEAPGGQGIEMAQLALSATGGDVLIDRVDVRDSGSANEANQTIYLIEDVNGDGIWESGVDALLGSDAYDKNNARMRIGVSLSIPSGGTRFLLIAYGLDGSPPDSSVFQLDLRAGGISSDAVLTTGLPINGSLKTVRTVATAPGSLILHSGSTNPVDTTEPNNAVGVAMLQLVLAPSTKENVAVSSVSFSGSGTGAEQPDVSAARLYVDVNSNGTLDSGVDLQLGSAQVFTADDGAITFGGLSRTLAAGALEHWLLVYDFGGSASNAETFQARLSANGNLTAVGVLSGLTIGPYGPAPYSGGTVTMSSVGSLSLAAGPFNPVAFNASADVQGIEMMHLSVTASAVENVLVSQVILTASGTADDRALSSGGDIANLGVRLYLDADDNGVLDSATDPQLGSSAAYLIDDGTVTFAGLGAVVTAGATENWLVVYDLAGSATLGQTFSTRLALNSDLTAQGAVSATSIVPTGAPVTGGTLTVSNVGSLTIEIGPNSPSDSNEAANALGLEMLQFSITAGTQEDVLVQDVTINARGTGSDNVDLLNPGVFIYRDTNGDGLLDGGDVMLGDPKRYKKDDGNVKIGNVGSVISAGATEYWLITYSLAGTASLGETFQCVILQSNDVTATGVTTGGGIGATGAPLYSSVKTISNEGTLLVALGADNPLWSQIPNDSQDLEMLQLRLSASSVEDMLVTDIVFLASGTGHDVNDISGVSIYVDANSSGIYESGTDTQIDGVQSYVADNGIVTFSSIAQTVAAGTTQEWLVVYDLNGTAANAETFGISLPSNSSVTVQGVSSGLGLVTGAPVVGNAMTISNIGTLTLSAGIHNSVNRNEANTALNLTMLQLELAANDTEGIAISSIRFTASGTADDRPAAAGDIAAGGVRLYVDINGNGLYDAGLDVQRGGAGDYSADNGNVTFSGFTRTISVGASELWLVVYDLAGTAAPDTTFVCSLPAGADVTAVGVVSGQPVNRIGTPVAGGTVTMAAIGSISVLPGAGNPVDSNIDAAALGLKTLQLAITASSAEDVQITEITLNAAGTADDRGDLNRNGVFLYRDENGDGLVDGGDTLLDGGNRYNADNGTVRMNGFVQTVTAGSSVLWIVAYDLSGSASFGETFRTVFASGGNMAATGVTSGLPIAVSGAPVQGGLLTVSNAGSISLQMGPENLVSPLGNTTELSGATYVEMVQVTLTASDNEAVDVTSITFRASGSGHDVNDIIAGSVRLYVDAGTIPGEWDAADTLLGTGASWTGDNGEATFSGTPLQSISAGASETWLLVADVASTAVNGLTFSATLASNSDVEATGVSSLQTVSISGAPIPGGTKTIVATGTLSLSVGPANPVDFSVATGSVDVEMIQVTLSAGPNEAVRITEVTIDALPQLGEDESDIDDVSVYRDVNGNGVFEAGADVLVAAGGTYLSDDGSVAFSGLSEVVAANSSVNWLVVYAFNAGASGGEAYQAGVAMTDIIAEGNATANLVEVGGTDVTGAIATIFADGTLSCALGPANPLATNELSDADGVELIQVRLAADNVEDITVQSIVFTDAGSNSGDLSTEMEAARLYLDANGNGIYDGDVQIGGGASISGATLTFSGMSEVVEAGSIEYWLLVVDLSGGAANPDTFVASVNAATDIDASASTVLPVAGTFPVSGNAISIAVTPTLSVVLGPETPANASVSNDDADVAMIQVSLSSSSAGDSTVTEISFRASGTANDLADVVASSLELYLDSGTSPGSLDASDTLIAGGGSWSADDGVVVFSGLSETISAGQTEKWLLLQDLVGSASGGEVFTVRLDASTDVVAAPAVISGSFPLQGGSMTVSVVGSLSIALGASTPAPASIAPDAQDVEMIQLSLTASAVESVSVTNISFAASGTGDDRSDSSLGDLADAGVFLYRDANSNGVLDGDPQIAVADFSADNGTVAFTGLSEVVAAGQTIAWLLVYDLDSTTPSASNGDSFRTQLTASSSVAAIGLASSQPIVPAGSFPLIGSTMTVSSVGTLVLSQGAQNPATASVANNEVNLALLQVLLSANSTENIGITAITFTARGTAHDVDDIAAGSIRLYEDVGPLMGGYDASDRLIASMGSFDIDNGVVTFASLVEVINAGSSEKWLVVYDLLGTGDDGETVLVKLADNSHVAAIGVTSASAITPSGAPLTGGTMTLVAPDAVLTVSAGSSNPGASSEFNNTSDLATIQAHLAASDSGSDIIVSSIVFTASGTANDVTDIIGGSVELYRDDGSSSGTRDAGDTLIQGGGTFSSDNGTVTFAGLSETIPSSGFVDWLVVCDLSGAASDGETLRVRIANPSSDVTATESGPAPTLLIEGAAVWGGLKTISSTSSARWDGSDSVFWSVPSNWEGNTVPSSSIAAVIPDSATTPNDPLVSGGSAKTILVEAGGLLMLSGGTFNVAAGITVEAGGMLQLSGATTLSMSGGTRLVVDGTLSCAGTSMLSSEASRIVGSGSGFVAEINGTVNMSDTIIDGLALDGAENAGFLLGGGGTIYDTIFLGLANSSGYYLSITGAGWNGAQLDGVAFAEVAGGPNTTGTVRIDVAASAAVVTVTNYPSTSPPWSSGSTTSLNVGDDQVVWSPLAVRMSRAVAWQTEAGTQLAWETATERINAGFHIERAADAAGPWERLTEVLVRGARSSRKPILYGWTDARSSSDAAFYRVLDVDLAGHVNVNDEFGVVHSIPAWADDRNASVSLAATRSAMAARRTVGKRLDGARSASPRAIGLKAGTGNLWRVVTTGEGVFSLDAATLTVMGITPTTPIALRTGGTAAHPAWEGSELRFLAQEFRARHTRQNVTLLTVGESASAPGPGSSTQDIIPHARVSVRLEEDAFYYPDFSSVSCRNGEAPWYYFDEITPLQSWVQNPDLGVVTSAAATIRMRLVGFSSTPAVTSDHMVELRVNTQLIGELTWDGWQSIEQSLDVAAGILTSGVNEIRLDAPSIAGAANETLVDWVEIVYEVPLAARNDCLRVEIAADESGVVTVTDFTGADISAFQIRDGVSWPLAVSSIDAGGGAFTARASVGGGANGAMLVLAGPAARAVPDLVEASQVMDLRASRGEYSYVVVAPRAFAAAASAITAYRTGRGQTVLAADLEDVYDEFSYGRAVPEAIRDLVAWHRPRFLLLLGDATYDPVDLSATGEQDHVPSFFVNDPVSEVVSDAPYSVLEGSSVPVVSVGRLPARDAAEAQDLVDKVIAGEASVSASDPAVLISDDDKPVYEQTCEAVRSVLAGPVQTMYVGTGTTAADARADLLATAATGARLVFYMGHGSTDRWAAEALLLTTDADTFAAGKATVVVALSCLNTQFGYESLGERLVRADNAGAWGVIGSVGFSDESTQSQFGVALAGELAQDRTLGDALLLAKRSLPENNGGVADTFVLLGDPASGGSSANSIHVVSPSGGETLPGGSSTTVLWTWTGSPGAQVLVEFSSAGGTNWSTIASDAPNTGSVEWTVPNIDASDCLVRVTATSSGTTDVSDSAFTIEVDDTLIDVATADDDSDTGCASGTEGRSTGGRAALMILALCAILARQTRPVSHSSSATADH